LPVEFGGVETPVKIDLLAMPVAEEQRKLVEIKKPRIKPRGATGIHGYLTEEAVTLEEQLSAIDISDGDTPLEIYLPHPFSYLAGEIIRAQRPS